MANHQGTEGLIHVGANAVSEVKNWSVNETADTVEDTTINDAARTYKPGLTAWSGSLTAFWDETDTTGQEALTIGASVTLNLYPEGNSTGDQYATGTAIVTSVGVDVPDSAGMITRAISFQGTGALTWGAAS